MTYVDGRLSDAFGGGTLANASIALSTGSTLTSDVNGSFRVALASPGDTPDLLVRLGGFFDRSTTIRAGTVAEVSMIPTGFDLRTFDEMFRSPQLTRWTSAPPLVVETTALKFAGFDGASFTATLALSDAEIAPLIDDMRWAMSPMTGGTFADFASVARQQSAPGASVSVLNPGAITVALYDGLFASTGYWGYGRTLVQPDGAVVGASVMIDRDFNRSSSPLRRALRSHELGHALGASHVVSRTSVMNAGVTTEPTAWDRDAARIAYRRPPGNRSPDSDPSGRSVNRASAAQWTVGVR